MILPIRDILSSQPAKAFRFGHHGLVVIVRGHEELFFEFSEEYRRTAFVRLLEEQIEDVRRRVASGESQEPTSGERDALILEEFGPRTPVLTENELPAESEQLDSSLPAVMFKSTSSTFLTFKPQKPLHFTFLTIGSRGDVQPYIALAKGLMADGHKTRIATHGEFKEWIESVSRWYKHALKQANDWLAAWYRVRIRRGRSCRAHADLCGKRYFHGCIPERGSAEGQIISLHSDTRLTLYSSEDGLTICSRLLGRHVKVLTSL